MGKILYSSHHVWVSGEGDTVRLGISDHAQESLGAILFLNLPDEGETVSIGERFGDIESVKTVSDLISPVSGEIVRVNEELMDMPEEINEHPYDCWFIEVRTDGVSEELMDEAAYAQYRETL